MESSKNLLAWAEKEQISTQKSSTKAKYTHLRNRPEIGQGSAQMRSAMYIHPLERLENERSLTRTSSTSVHTKPRKKLEARSPMYEKRFCDEGFREALATDPASVSHSADADGTDFEEDSSLLLGPAKKEKKVSAAKQMMTKLKQFGRTSGDASKTSIESQSQLVKATAGAHRVQKQESKISEAGCVRPLQVQRLRARSKPAGTSRRTVSDDCSSISSSTVARNRGKAARLLEGIIDEDDSIPYDLESPQVLAVLEAITSKIVKSSDNHEHPPEPSSGPSEQQLMHVGDAATSFQLSGINRVVRDLVLADECRGAWKCYLTAYSTGKMNLSYPPSPPMKGARFEYLPAVFPADELTRLAVSEEFDIVWKHWSREKAKGLIECVMAQFGTNYVALSIFDEDSEIFKAENGINQSRIARSTSIAAHCIFSQDVMVVLDTRKDWRFKKNPLVIGRPHIRFFAGAPLMSPCGQVLGVLTVFGSRPRASFSHDQRRELANFAALLMRDLKQEADGLSNACLRTTPLLERDSCIFDYHPRKMSSVSSLSHNGEEPELIPSALIYQKSKEPESKIDIGPSNHHTRQSPVEPTPPPSSESNIAFADVPNISNRFAHFSSASILSKDFSPRGSTFDGLRAYSPRPFSSSDLTSLHPHPPNTPTQSLQDGEIYTIPEFDLSEKDFSELPNNDRKCKGKARDSQGSGHSRSLRREPLLDVNRRNNHQDTLRTRYSGEPPSHKDLASPAIGSATPSRDFPSGCQIPDVPSSPLIDLYGPFSEDTHPQQKQDESSVRYADSPTTSKRRIIVPPIVTRRLLSVDWEDLDLDSICAMNAQRLGYDILYAVRVRPSESLLVGEELQVPESFEIDLLASYGIATDSPLDSKFHLGVLRGTEPQFYVGPTIDGGPGSLESARLLPVEVEQGPPEGRRSGIVVGAYRTAGNIHFDEEPDEDGDLTKFVEFCASLVTVLSGKERKQEAKSNTAPATPTAGPAYTAHEIRQLGVGNHSFDAHHRNWI